MGRRVSAIDLKSSSIDELHRELAGASQSVQRIRKENHAFSSRLDEMEDKSRRDSLVFHGVDDCLGETWAQAEEKVVRLLSDLASSIISREQIIRAHPLGPFIKGKRRPILVKFQSFNTRESVLQAKSKLKTSPISVSENVSFSTRLARRKLLEYGKSQENQLSYNKLFVNNKCYAYNEIEDYL